jgi:hypothetical protein
MTSFSSREHDTGSFSEAFSPLQIGHFYWDVRAARLYRLNAVARTLHEGDIPILETDAGREYLRTAQGEPVGAGDLPLSVALREGRPVEATFVFCRPGRPPCHLVWNATPLRDVAGKIAAVMATVCRTPPPHDWHTLAGLAHDLRSPLQAIRLMLVALGQRRLGEAQQAEVLHLLGSAAERALQIGADLLDWCRVPGSSGRKVESSWIPLEPLLRRLLQEELPAAGSKKITLTASLEDIKGWELFSDRTRLGRVIMNLLGNAVRYTPRAGHVALTASWQGQGTERELVLGVADTGTGITPEEQESIFQPFERGKSSRGDSSGSGLGLAVVDQLVEELGLRREVSSEYGRGSSFRILVPQRLLRFAPSLAAVDPGSSAP